MDPRAWLPGLLPRSGGGFAEAAVAQQLPNDGADVHVLLPARANRHSPTATRPALSARHAKQQGTTTTAVAESPRAGVRSPDRSALPLDEERNRASCGLNPELDRITGPHTRIMISNRKAVERLWSANDRESLRVSTRRTSHCSDSLTGRSPGFLSSAGTSP